MLTLTPLTATMLVSLVLPIAVGLVTKTSAPPLLKQIVAALASAATGLIATATQIDGTAVLSRQALLLAVISFVAQQATYLGVYKPQDANAKLVPNFGIGPAAQAEAP
jgi:hypothetical protein